MSIHLLICSIINLSSAYSASNSMLTSWNTVVRKNNTPICFHGAFAAMKGAENVGGDDAILSKYGH